MVWMQSLVTQMTSFELDLLGELILAALLGGVIGWERETSDKPAGLRTNLLICVGAALLAHVSIYFATASEGVQVRADPARIAAQIVSGVGFLGAGTIIQARGSVTGLTTAATLWVVAAIGIAVGGGAYLAAVGATGLVLIALLPLGWLEQRIEARRRHRMHLTLRVSLADGVIRSVEELLRSHRLDVDTEEVEKDREAGRLVLFITAKGSPESLEAARQDLLARKDVHAFSKTERTPG